MEQKTCTHFKFNLIGCLHVVHTLKMKSRIIDYNLVHRQHFFFIFFFLHIFFLIMLCFYYFACHTLHSFSLLLIQKWAETWRKKKQSYLIARIKFSFFFVFRVWKFFHTFMFYRLPIYSVGQYSYISHQSWSRRTMVIKYWRCIHHFYTQKSYKTSFYRLEFYANINSKKCYTKSANNKKIRKIKLNYY